MKADIRFTVGSVNLDTQISRANINFDSNYLKGEKGDKGDTGNRFFKEPVV